MYTHDEGINSSIMNLLFLSPLINNFQSGCVKSTYCCTQGIRHIEAKANDRNSSEITFIYP